MDRARRAFGNRAFREMAVLFVFSLVVIGVASTFDVFEAFAGWSKRHEAWQADELIALATLLCFGLGVFSWRRWMETRSKVAECRRTEEELRKAKEEAAVANRAKSIFLSDMSHEISTPMNGVIDMSEFLMGTDLDSEQRDCVETVRSSGVTLLNILNDILAAREKEECDVVPIA